MTPYHGKSNEFLNYDILIADGSFSVGLYGSLDYRAHFDVLIEFEVFYLRHLCLPFFFSFV